MDLSEVFTLFHDLTVATWAYHMLKDKCAPCSQEPLHELTISIDRGADCFREAVVKGHWADLGKFINFIGEKRLHGGFTLAEVQRSLEQHQASVIPLLLTHIHPSLLTRTLLRLHEVMVLALTRSSTTFQDLHEEVLRNHAQILEKELPDKTRKLAASERNYKILVEDINDGYFVLVEGTIVYANNAFTRMHGSNAKDIRGKRFLDFGSPQSREAVHAAYAASIDRATLSSRIKYFRLRWDCRQLPTEIVAQLSSYGGQVAYTGVCTDVTERVESERKTREAENLGALAEFNASLAHEVNNLLTAIKMNSQMFEQEELPEDARQKLLSTTLGEIDRIRRSIAEMIDSTIPFRVNYRSIRLREFVQRCLRTVEHRLVYQGGSVLRRLSSLIEHVRVDPERIEQALVNPLLNALDALPAKGRIFIRSKATWDKGQPWVHIRVADDGPGIPEEKRQYVFDPFFSQKAGGIGLRLGNVKKIVEAHGGRVQVTRRMPRGVAFTIILPRK